MEKIHSQNEQNMCEVDCGHWIDPKTQATFNVASLCDQELSIPSDQGFYRLNICGEIPCPQQSFCIVAADSICGLDGESAKYGMLIRNSTEKCGYLSCNRCDVWAYSEPSKVIYSLLEAETPVEGFRMRFPPVPLTKAQRDETDKNGFCIGGEGKTTTINFHCDCSKTTTELERVWSDDARSCLLNVDVRSKEACYEGFCDGYLPPGMRTGTSWIFFVLIAIAVAVFVTFRRRRNLSGYSGLPPTRPIDVRSGGDNLEGL